MSLKRFPRTVLNLDESSVTEVVARANAQGQTIVLWPGYDFSTGTLQLSARVFDSNSGLAGNVVSVLATKVDPYFSGQLLLTTTIMDNGDFKVVWDLGNHTGVGDLSAKAQVITSSGVAIGAPVTLTTVFDGDTDQIIETGLNSFPIATGDRSNNTGKLTSIRLFNDELEYSGSTLDFATFSSGAGDFSDLGVLDNGNFAVAFKHTTGGHSIALQIFDASGQAVSTPTAIDPPTYNGSAAYTSYGSPDVTTRDDGTIAVSWSGQSFLENFYFRSIHSPAGEALGPPLVVPLGRGVYASRVAEIDNGRFAVLLSIDSSFSPLASGAYLRIMTADGVAATEDIFIGRPSDPITFELGDDGKLQVVLFDLFSDRYISTSFDPDSYTFSAADDHWIGTPSETRLRGLDGDDVIGGSAANNQLYGDAGDDLIIASAGIDRINGGSGVDTADYSNEDGVIHFALDGSLTTKGVIKSDVISAIENIRGSRISSNMLAGDSQSNVLTGGDVGDRLYGRAGDDVLAGGKGGDFLNGGSGFDIADYSIELNIRRGLTLSLANFGVASGTAEGDSLVSIEAVIGTNLPDTIIGNDSDNLLAGNDHGDKLYGGGGDDILIGGQGANRIWGGGGSDTADYEWHVGRVNLQLSDDTVSGWSFDQSGDFLFEDTLYSVENVTGSAKSSDKLSGNKYGNVLNGLGGNDTLSGKGGDDELQGGDGNDVIDGGSGSDIVSFFDQSYVFLSLDESFARAGSVGSDRFTAIEGIGGSNTGNDKLAGNAFANELLGYGGNDRLYGRGGDDVLAGGGGVDLVDGGTGQDIASYFEEGAVVVALDGSVTASGAAKGDRLIAIESLSGSNSGSDKLLGDRNGNDLLGNGGNDKLYGRAGDDILDGGAGKDFMSGGSGHDVFMYRNIAAFGDTIDDFAAGDRIRFSIRGLNDENELFGVSNSNRATEFNMHLIFRTTDGTLWHDGDGVGTGFKPVLVATFENGYQLKATDILY